MLFSYDDYFEEFLDLYENDPEIGNDKTAVSKFLIHKYNIKKSINACRHAFADRLNRYYADKDIVKENVKLAKEKQKAQDKNRIANKSFREYARLENALEEFAKAQLKIYKDHAKELKNIKLKPLLKNNGGVGVIQISDLHGNELVNLPHNKYDFNILSKRLRLHIQNALLAFKLRGIKKVVMLFTGDLLNSDRRLDELLNAATNRAKACSLMRHIILQAILETRNAGHDITIVSVLGNESRVDKEMPFSNEGLSNNYDFMIMDGIKHILEFSKIKGIRFSSIDKVETVISIDNNNWLIAHNVSRIVDNQKNAQSAIGRMVLNGEKIRFVIGGHIHATHITDISARSGSTVGANSYSENALNLAGRASQNYFICRNGKIQSCVSDLQDIENIEGYDIIKQLESYNAKSVSKLDTPKTIFKVVV